jgi:cytochrome c oxidase subunit 2
VRKSLIIQLLAMSVLFGGVSFVVAWFIPWLPDAGSKEAERIHDTYWLASIICLAIISIVAAVTVYAVVKFRARPDDDEDGKPIHGHTGIEVAWTLIPLVLVIVIGVWSSVALVRNEEHKEGRVEIDVHAAQFAWSFSYPEQELPGPVGELHVPIGEPIKLTLTSNDVIHSFWVPEWSVKQDVVPGVELPYYITPTKEGTFDIICTELCGIGHSVMRNRVVVETRAKFDAWVEKMKEGGGAGGADGQTIFIQNCGSCHALADAGTTGEVGPNLDTVLPGLSEDAVLESIVDPNAEITDGYQPDVMPGNFGELLSDEQLDALVEYLTGAVG